jgi:predicted MPP superfamily phosphohydrolase
MAYAPDMIVLTGDLISLTVKYAKSCARVLATLKAPSGVFAVLGNHEYWTDRVKQVVTAYRDAGVNVLVNDPARVSVPGLDWWLCGLDDIWEGKPDLDGMLGRLPEYGFKLLLCHEPDFADEAAKRNLPLQLSGHSHGGQIRVPGVGPIRLPIYARKYPYGLQRVPDSDTRVYTTAGVGVTFPPIRINCRPEVAILRLARTG